MFLILSNLQFWCVILGQLFRMVSIMSINLLRHVSQDVDTFGRREGWLSERLETGEQSQKGCSLFPGAGPLPHCLLSINILFIPASIFLLECQVNPLLSACPNSHHLLRSTLHSPFRVQVHLDLFLLCHLQKLPTMSTILTLSQITSSDLYLSSFI